MRLILVKHAEPLVDPAVPPSQWHLSDDGRRSSGRLAVALRAFAPEAFFTSPQPKAAETAALVSASFGTTAIACDDLREHDDRGAPFFENEVEFAKAIEELFARPDERVFGSESATEALARFGPEVDRLVDAGGRGPLVVVSHGRAISLYVASRMGLSAFELWRALTLPSFVVLDTETWRVDHVAWSV